MYGENSDASEATGIPDSLFTHYGYSKWLNASGNLEPNLGCTNRRDSFTKSSTLGNGQLRYKVGLISSSEMVLAGIPQYNAEDPNAVDEDNYLYTGNFTWTISPFFYPSNYAAIFGINSAIWNHGVYDQYGLRPVISLKAGTQFASGSGAKADPFIVK